MIRTSSLLGPALALLLILTTMPARASEIRTKAFRMKPRSVILECTVSSSEDEDIENSRDRALRHVPGLSRDAELIEGDFVVAEGDVFRGDLIVHGDLTILGTVRGDAVAFGDIVLGPEARVRGDVAAINGRITREEGSEVRGDVVEIREKRTASGRSRIRSLDRKCARLREEVEERFPRRVRGEILFQYEDPEATEVSLVGDFNDWDEDADPMVREGDLWQRSVPLAKGRYEYAFVVDGRWGTDPSNPDEVRDREKDTYYSVIHVDERGRVQSPKTCRESARIRRTEWNHEVHEIDLKADYNRVDGFYLGPTLDLGGRPGYRPRVRGEIGYAFARKTWLGEIEVTQPLIGADNGLALGFNYHEITDVHDFDREIISDTENTLAALFLKEDFRDYYENVGGAVFADAKMGNHANLRVGYGEDDLASLNKNTDWAVFGKNKCFRCNPTLTDSIPFCDIDRQIHCRAHESCEPATYDLGTLKSLRALFVLDFRNDRDYPTRGLWTRLGFETAGGDLGGDYEFTKYWVDLRKYTRLAPRWFLDLRVMAGAADDVLPPWKEYYVGGIGTLTARRFKEFRGDRVLLGSLEYRVALSDEFQGAFFVDSGDAWYDAEREYDLKTDVGVAIQDSDHDFRIGYAKKSEDLSEEGVWTLRLNRSF